VGEAVEWIRRAVAVAPGAGQLWNDLGSALGASGKIAEAVEAFGKALELEPGNGDAACNLGMALVQSREYTEAVEVLWRAAKLRPGDLQIWTALGDADRELGRFEEAIQAYEQAAKLNPSDAQLQLRLGVALKARGRVEEALGAYMCAGELSPTLGEAYFNAGNALRDLKRPGEAAEAYGRAIAANPNYADAFHNLATLFEQQERWEDAAVAFAETVRLRPEFQPAYRGWGKALVACGKYDEAVATLRRAVEMDPGSWESVLSLGDALQKIGAEGEALQMYSRAAKIRPDEPSILVNWGGLLDKLNDAVGAMGKYRHALDIRPDSHEARFNLSLTLLRKGQFEEGWEKYESRWHLQKRNFDLEELPQPLWQGEDLHGKRVLVHVEQGFGDAFQFVRYLPFLEQRGAQVIMRCHDILRRLFQQSLPSVRLLGEKEPLPEFDYQVPMVTLARVMGTRPETIPAQVPYLMPSDDLIAAWRHRLGERVAGEKRVGLAWAGNPKHDQDRARSMALSMLGPLALVDGARFFSLQKGDPQKQIASSSPGLAIIDLGDELKDFADTAAVMMNLDLIVCVDTAVAHLAGALARPAWVMLRNGPEWRWLEGRTDSPWYPTMRLFRQERAGDWTLVVKTIVDELSQMEGAREH
jgi:tetratricopeptide (TPR) repeat protein